MGNPNNRIGPGSEGVCGHALLAPPNRGASTRSEELFWAKKGGGGANKSIGLW